MAISMKKSKTKITMESLNAVYSISAVGEEFAEIFSSMDDEYMKARAADIKDITKRVLDNLLRIYNRRNQDRRTCYHHGTRFSSISNCEFG